MRAIVQRVSEASVKINGELVSSIMQGYMVLLGITETDTTKEADYIVGKLAKLRLFKNEQDGKAIDLALQAVNGQILLVSQFTLYADCSKGNRPSFIKAAKPEIAEPLYEYVIQALRSVGITVQTGCFGADMQISLVNDGPVTVILEK